MPAQDKDPLLGTRIREYEILEVIGRGGMGSVYKARHVYLDEERAIKVISARLAGDKDFVDRFIREAKILIKLQHPNLVQLFEFGTLGEDTFFMVLELIRGQSVFERIRNRGRLPVQESIKIIREAALGLHNAHQKGIVHRDISPDNLMLVKNEAGEEITKVLDFGIAKPLFETAQQFTMTNMFIGKPEYCSPEQCGSLEEGEIIDRRSDIYSLIITFYQMIAGKTPFFSKNPTGYLVKHLSEAPAPVSTHFSPGEIPEALDRLILKSLSKKRNDRQASMAELVTELDALSAPAVVVVPRTVVSDLHAGEMFAHRYRIEKEIGRGGMGKIYKATDKILEVPVALKIMELIHHDERAIERFKREVVIARKVAHPNVCRIYDMGESGGLHYVSMEFLEGKTLAEMLRKEGRFTPEVGIPLLKQVLQALQEAHRVGVVHRDLKPENIMVDLSHRAHIMDFGISISFDVGRLTQTGALIGTPYYMAPEQFEGKNTDHRADIYSLGVIMFQMFTGKLPFESDTPMGIIFAHLKSEPPKPTSIAKDIPPELEAIILKALQKDAEQRYQTVRDLLAEIEPLLAPTTSLGVTNPEQAVHKLLAEQSYSKAVKFLHTMLKRQPQNQKFKKLLTIATTEKIKRDIHRTKYLIHKKNLVQAQLLLEKINRLHPENTKTISQVRKLQELLETSRDEAVSHYLTEAGRLLDRKDLTGAESNVESAWSLKPNDQRIAEFREKIRVYKDNEGDQKHLVDLNEIKQMWFQGKGEEASARLNVLLQHSPEFRPALSFRAEIEEKRQIENEGQKIKRELEQVFAPLKTLNFERSFSILDQLSATVKERPFQMELSRIRNGVQEISASFAGKKFVDVPEVIQLLYSNDPNGWLAPYRSSFSDLEKMVKERAGMEAIDHELAETTHLYQREAYQQALQKVNSVLQRAPDLDAALKLKNAIDRAILEQKTSSDFQAAFDEGKKHFDELRWQESIECWQKALRIYSNPTVQEWIAAAQERIDTERRIRKEISNRLGQGAGLISSKKYGEADRLVAECRKAITPEYRLQDLHSEIDRLAQRLKEERDREETRLVAINKEVEEATHYYNQKEYHQALQRVDHVLQNEPELPGAVKLKSDIASRIQEQRVTENLTGKLQDVIRAILEERSQDLVAALGYLQSAANDTSQGRAAAVLADELFQFQKEKDEGDLTACRKRLEKLVHSSPLLKMYEGQIRQFLGRLVEQEKRKAEYTRLVQDAISKFQAQRFDKALETFQKLDQMYPGQPQIQQYISASLERIQQMQQSKSPATPIPREILPVTDTTPSIFKNPLVWVAVFVIVALAGTAFWFLTRKPSSPPPPAMVSVTLNALPWARVKLTPVTEGIQPPQIPEEEAVTPCSFVLAEGDYTVSMQSDTGSTPLVKTITVKQGGNNSFVWTMPSFDSKQALERIHKNRSK